MQHTCSPDPCERVRKLDWVADRLFFVFDGGVPRPALRLDDGTGWCDGVVLRGWRARRALRWRLA